MSLLKNLTTDESIKKETDSVGSGGVLNSGAYESTVTLAYVKAADSGALGLFVHFKSDDGREFRTQAYMTSGRDKGNKNYYEKDGEKSYLPGFNLANSLALLTIGKGINELDTEEKVVKLYDYTAKSEVPTRVQAITELHGQKIIVGLLKQTVDKTKKNDATKQYEPTGETRDENEVDKFFRAKDRMTTTEIIAGATEPSFYNTWTEKWTDKVKVKAKGAAGTAGAPKTGAAGGSTTKPSNSLFG